MKTIDNNRFEDKRLQKICADATGDILDVLNKATKTALKNPEQVSSAQVLVIASTILTDSFINAIHCVMQHKPPHLSTEIAVQKAVNDMIKDLTEAAEYYIQETK